MPNIEHRIEITSLAFYRCQKGLCWTLLREFWGTKDKRMCMSHRESRGGFISSCRFLGELRRFPAIANKPNIDGFSLGRESQNETMAGGQAGPRPHTQNSQSFIVHPCPPQSFGRRAGIFVLRCQQLHWREALQRMTHSHEERLFVLIIGNRYVSMQQKARRQWPKFPTFARDRYGIHLFEKFNRSSGS